MINRKRTRLNLGVLEDRLAPAVTASFVGGSLTLRGDNTANTVVVTQTANNTLQVSANAKNLGTYAVTGSLNILMGNSSDAVTLNLGGFSFGGNVSVSTGNNSFKVNDTVAVNAGTIQGNFVATTGFGDDAVALAGVALQGFATLSGSLGFDSFDTDAASTGSGITTTSGFNAVTLRGTTGNTYVTMNDVAAAKTNTFSLIDPGSVTGNLVVTGSGGPDTANIDGNVDGNLLFNALEGNNTLTFTSGGPTVGGSVSYFSGGGLDALGVDGSTSVAGNFTANMGNGNNFYGVGDAAFVAGNFSLTAGGGNDVVGPFGFSVSGNIAVDLGNGSNIIDFVTPGFGGGNVTYRGGGGIDDVTVTASFAGAFRAFLGAGDDVLTYGAGISLGSAYIDFGAGIDTFNDGGNTVTWPQTIIGL